MAKLLANYNAGRFTELNVAAQKQNGGGKRASNVSFTDLENQNARVEF